MAPKGRWGRKEKKDEPRAPVVLPVRRSDFDMPDAICVLLENYYTIEECERYMEMLTTEIDWKKQQVAVGGRDRDLMKEVEEPRLTTFMSDPGICYEYSGRENVGVGWHPGVLEIKKKAEQAVVECGLPPVQFNSVQMNRYEGPRHTLGMHADDEPDLEREAPIASVSFGTRRDFKVLAREDQSQVWYVPLADGSFLVMGGMMQQKYLHGIPPGDELGLRINLTFRRCIPRESSQCTSAPGVGGRLREAKAHPEPEGDAEGAEPQPARGSAAGGERPSFRGRGAAAPQPQAKAEVAAHGSAAPRGGASCGFYAEDELRAMHSHNGAQHNGKGKGRKGKDSEPLPAARGRPGKGYVSAEDGLLGQHTFKAGKGKTATWGAKR